MRRIVQTAGPFITQKEIDYVLDAVKNGWYENWSGYINKFEKKFAEYIGTKYAIATSSCTGAMHLALAALHVKEEDEVIVPESTWVATAAVVTYLGATPVFVDVDKDTWTIDVGSIKKAINQRTKGIIPVHMYGHPADMDKIKEIAEENDLFILEDAAPSIGSEYKGKKTGGLGDAGAFSFQGAKLLVTGEGGMLVTNDDKIYERASFLANQGRDANIHFLIHEIGYKYKMSNIQAALGLAQLERIDELIQKKRQIYGWYKARLEGKKGIRLNAEKEWAKSNHWMTSIVLENSISIEREVLTEKLKEKNIDTRPIFPPVSGFPMFKKATNPVAEFVGRRGINLPSAFRTTKEEVDFVSESILELIE